MFAQTGQRGWWITWYQRYISCFEWTCILMAYTNPVHDRIRTCILWWYGVFKPTRQTWGVRIFFGGAATAVRHTFEVKGLMHYYLWSKLYVQIPWVLCLTPEVKFLGAQIACVVPVLLRSRYKSVLPLPRERLRCLLLRSESLSESPRGKRACSIPDGCPCRIRQLRQHRCKWIDLQQYCTRQTALTLLADSDTCMSTLHAVDDLHTYDTPAHHESPCFVNFVVSTILTAFVDPR